MRKYSSTVNIFLCFFNASQLITSIFWNYIIFRVFHAATNVIFTSLRRCFVFVRPCCFTKWNIAPSPWRSFLKFCTKVHTDSRMNKVEFHSQRSKVKTHCDLTKHVLVLGLMSGISLTPPGDFLKSGTNFHLDSNMNWFDFGGKRSKVTTHFWP